MKRLVVVKSPVTTNELMRCGNVGIRSLDFHISTRAGLAREVGDLASRRAAEPRGAYGAFGDAGRPSIRVLRRFGSTADAGGDTLRGTTISHDGSVRRPAKRSRFPLISWLARKFLPYQRSAYAARAGLIRKTVSSRQRAYKMRLSRRASATTAMRAPRRAARRSVHCRSGVVRAVRLRQHVHAA